ncbi:hypothetical protein Pfo_011602 [Paulownia fortunei]|nr:hypothetical protein Pfo_011602 [Paulownia fortunei]
MATSRLFTLLGPSILRNSRNFSQIPPLKFNKICLLPSLRFKHYSSSALTLDSDACTLTTDDSSAVSVHPWPEWVNFVDRLKAKGYLTQDAAVLENGGGADDEGVVVYTETKLVKDACLSFARDRFDIFKSLSTQDIQTVVEKGCPNLFRKAVNSAKRLRAYLDLDEGNVCSSCNLRGSCDRAYIMLNDSEGAARTVDVVRILLHYALDPLVISGENKPPGRELVESSARKLFSQLIELGETHPDPDLPKPASVTSQRKKQCLDSSDNERSKNVEMKQGDWVCTKCNFMNFAKNRQCRSCGNDAPRGRGNDGVMKRGDWICPGCNFMNFARNIRCPKCKTEGPKTVSVDEVAMKKGDWNCPQCSYMNFASNRQCFRCQEPRPQRQLRPGDWECPHCDFLNFSRNTVCKRCNLDRPQESALEEQTWKKPY